jgi:SAM-dependent methyltransferase
MTTSKPSSSRPEARASAGTAGRAAAALPSWSPHGLALRDFLAGDLDAEVIVRAEDGEEERTPARVFVRGPADFSALDEAALDLCRGRVLDVGAGAGCHSLVLQARGISVTALDVSPEAVDVMRRRGVRDVRCGDVFAFAGERFDTVLILMNGIGLVGTLVGLDRFLRGVSRLVSPGGQILLDSFDPGPQTPGRSHGYAGEMRFQLEYRGVRGAYYHFVFLDFETLRRRAAPAGWCCESIWQEDEGHYLARLTRCGTPEGAR